MKSYTITIETIEEKMIARRKWVQVDPYKDKDGEMTEFDYRTEENPEKVSLTIYTQTTDKEIDLKKIIDAFNEAK